MGRNSIQFQKGLSVPEFQRLYGTEAQCEEALAHMRWPDGFRCPRCEGGPHAGPIRSYLEGGSGAFQPSSLSILLMS